MLVLIRKQQQSICINGNVIVTVLGIQGSKVRLGVEAPMEVPVNRKEVHDRIWREEGAVSAVGREEGAPA